jgi:hypothetical protein
MKILKKLATLLLQSNMTLEEGYNCIHEDQKYDTIRIEEPDLFRFHPLPLLQFIMPTFGKNTLIRENRSLGLDKMPLPELSLNQFFSMKNR